MKKWFKVKFVWNIKTWSKILNTSSFFIILSVGLPSASFSKVNRVSRNYVSYLPTAAKFNKAPYEPAL